MNTRMVTCAAAGMIWLSLSPDYVHAGMMNFGTEEEIHEIQPTRDPNFTLCHKVRTYFFVGGIYVADDGYVLQKKGQYGYYPLDAARIRALQEEGVLPTPLPPYSLSLWDRLCGYSLWIGLVFVIGIPILNWLRSRATDKLVSPSREPPSAEQAALEIGGDPPPVDSPFNGLDDSPKERCAREIAFARASRRAVLQIVASVAVLPLGIGAGAATAERISSGEAHVATRILGAFAYAVPAALVFVLLVTASIAKGRLSSEGPIGWVIWLAAVAGILMAGPRGATVGLDGGLPYTPELLLGTYAGAGALLAMFGVVRLTRRP